MLKCKSLYSLLLLLTIPLSAHAAIGIRTERQCVRAYQAQIAFADLTYQLCLATFGPEDSSCSQFYVSLRTIAGEIQADCLNRVHCQDRNEAISVEKDFAQSEELLSEECSAQ